ncbi:MAG TPA: hypothetical protein VL326_23390 [Kofleriaceae bacterium]|nr:hypothetical protein [Kofleriaceae bacterium]
MRHLARHLAVVACIAVTATAVDAAPRRGQHTRVFKKKKKHVTKAGVGVEVARASDDDDDDESDDDAKPEPKKARAHKAARHVDDDDRDEDSDDEDKKRDKTASLEAEDEAIDEASDEEDADEEETDEAEASLTLHKAPLSRKDWSIAFGPYVWASSVDANVSLGSANVAAGVDFIDITRHTKFGIELLGEARYRKLSVAGDFTYGVVALNGAREVGPFMVSVDGTATSLMADGTAGYTVAGNDHSLVAIEGRAGIRYQRTAVAVQVGVNESMLTPPAVVMSSKDALAGTRVFVRPSKRFYVSGSGDIGVFGDSTLTWSAAVDASVHVGSHVLLSLGWRTMTTESPTLSMVMHGPRFAAEATF